MGTYKLKISWTGLLKWKEDAPKEGKAYVRTWPPMKQLIMDRFLPVDFEQYLYRIYHNCIQGHRTVVEYTFEFLRLVEHKSTEETNSQQVARTQREQHKAVAALGIRVFLRDRILTQNLMEITVIIAANRATNPTIVPIVGKLTWLKRMRVTMRIMMLMKSTNELILPMRKAMN
ncbi:PREDICTED: LOC110094610 [Prunus dulcis]|uniref:PREDICTED: LOC110094610 n=1 Tax=Prunus dulcis TaxID=3755 RepID=A0A5E4FHH2_PRUDU|nr:PREDICTED: LOC110094610 [Prunus dulcis]